MENGLRIRGSNLFIKIHFAVFKAVLYSFTKHIFSIFEINFEVIFLETLQMFC